MIMYEMCGCVMYLCVGPVREERVCVCVCLYSTVFVCVCVCV